MLRGVSALLGEGSGPRCLFQLRVGEPSGPFSNLKMTTLEWWCLVPSQLQGDSIHVWKLSTLQLGLRIGSWYSLLPSPVG